MSTTRWKSKDELLLIGLDYEALLMHTRLSYQEIHRLLLAKWNATPAQLTLAARMVWEE